MTRIQTAIRQFIVSCIVEAIEQAAARTSESELAAAKRYIAAEIGADVRARSYVPNRGVEFRY